MSKDKPKEPVTWDELAEAIRNSPAVKLGAAMFLIEIMHEALTKIAVARLTGETALTGEMAQDIARATLDKIEAK
jgi:hypothetical protein